MLGNQLRLEGAVAVPRRGDGQLAHVALHRFGGMAVATVGGALLARGSRCGFRGRFHHGRLAISHGQRLAPQVNVQLGVEHPLQRRLHHQPHQVVEVFRRPGLAGELVC